MSEPGVRVYIDADSAIRDITLGLDRASPQVEKAITRAIKKTMQWLARQVVRDIAKNSGVAQKALKTRIHSRINQKQQYGTVWIGLNPVPAELAGKPVQNSRGVSVAGQFFEHAFFKRVYGDEPAVYRRKFIGPGSQAQTKQALHQGKSDKRSLFGRFPVERIKIDIAAKGTITAKALQRAGTARFRTVLQQELNYALNVEKR